MKPHASIVSLVAALIGGVAATSVLAQTSTTTTTTTANPAPSSPGAFDQLSPGNQRIAQALFSAQTPLAPGSSGPAPMTLDQIATAKGSTGWGQVFHEMQAQGLTQARNLGQVVSGRFTPPTAASATTTPAIATSQTQKTTVITTGSGRTVMVGGSGHGANAATTTITTAAGNSAAAGGAGVSHGNGNHNGGANAGHTK